MINNNFQNKIQINKLFKIKFYLKKRKNVILIENIVDLL